MQKQKKNLKYKRNKYYLKDLIKLSNHLIPKERSIIEFGSKGGEVVSCLKNKTKVGIVFENKLLHFGRKKYPKTKLVEFSSWRKLKRLEKFDYILLNHVLSDVEDIQDFISKIRRFCKKDTKIIVFQFNFLWKPLLDLAEAIGLKMKRRKEPNWLSVEDTTNVFYLESFERIKSANSFLFPLNLGFVSNFVNRFLAPLPIVNKLCLTNYIVFRQMPLKQERSVSVVIPAQNEEGNIAGILNKIPNLGKKTEIIFVEGHSEDKTLNAIKKEIKKYSGSHVCKLYKQRGIGKADAVRLGFNKASGDILMILDADLTVAPNDLKKFYNSCSKGAGDLIIGNRLIYPMKKDVMRTLNYIGNKIFSLLFTFLLNQQIKDTLCGTKVILRTNYQKIQANRKIFGEFDPFGDFDLLFGASKLNMKIIEVPIRYRQRQYGFTNISRFRHGILLMKMVLFAAARIKFI